MSLPRAWVRVRLGEVGDIKLGKMLDSSRTQGTRLPYLRNINIRWDSIDTSDLLTMPFKDDEVERYAVEPGDLLVCEGGEPGRSAVWVHGNTDIKYQKALHRVRLPQGISGRWVMFSLMHDASTGRLARQFTGSTIAHLPRERLAEYELSVAPASEQQRIIDALDSYFSRLDQATANLHSAQRKLKAYRASVLKAAVEGRLVPTEAELARKEGRSYEPADVLLERILKERRRRWEEAELAKMRAAGKTPKDDRWKAKYSEPEPVDVNNLPHLPEGWCWAPVSSFYWDAGYGTSAKCTEDAKGPAVLRIPNIVAGRIELDDLKFAVDDAALGSDGQVRTGDFLFIRTNGSRSLIGRGALVVHEPSDPLFFASYLIRLRLVTTDACDRWFALAWDGPSVRDQILRVAASSAGQHNVSLSAASSFAIPLPPTAEQARILAEYERLTSEAAAVERDIASALKRGTRLRQAVLNWAFEGKLVDQDPADEPADVLLARVRAEREAAAVAQPRANRARKLKVAS